MKKKRYTKSRRNERLSKLLVVVTTVMCMVMLLTATAYALTPDKLQKYEIQTIELKAETIKNTNIIFEELEVTASENEEIVEESSNNKIYIRCTVYCDTGYTASGKWTKSGCLAGKREWMGKKCTLYRVNKDNSCGEEIGTFTFYDTGFGLKKLDGVRYSEGTIDAGMSIDMWHPTEELCWDYVAEYGDYVYMEFLD